MKFKNIFVTVGTTEFDNLILRLSEADLYDLIKNHLGCQKLSIQIGNGKGADFTQFKGIEMDVFTLKDSISNNIVEADLVR